MKILSKIIKKITLALALLLSYNMLVSSLNLSVSINPFSILTVTAVGFPGLLSMIILKLMIK